MKSLVDKTSKKVLCVCPEDNPQFTETPGSWGEKLKIGELMIANGPDNYADVKDLVYDEAQSKVVKSPGKVSKDARRARLLAAKADSVNTLPELKAIVADLVEEWKA